MLEVSRTLCSKYDQGNQHQDAFGESQLAKHLTISAFSDEKSIKSISNSISLSCAHTEDTVVEPLPCQSVTLLTGPRSRFT